MIKCVGDSAGRRYSAEYRRYVLIGGIPEMREEFIREAMLFGEDAPERLAECRVAVFGLGGVGSWTAEALARSAVGAIDLIDNDVVAPSNINRQLPALHSTVGRPKTQVMAERLRDINPDISIKTHDIFILPGQTGDIDFSAFDYVVDAIDTVSGKLEIIQRCAASGTPVISSMGTGNKTDPSRLCVTDITKTHTCPLARVIRLECRKRGIKKLKVVYSEEKAATPFFFPPDSAGQKKRPPASSAFVPPSAGLLLAREVVISLLDLTARN